MTEDSHDKSKGEGQHSCYFTQKFHISTLPNSSFTTYLHFFWFVPHIEITRSLSLSRIPVTDIAQPCGVNAMKVSER
jgi:hypothetical protein